LCVTVFHYVLGAEAETVPSTEALQKQCIGYGYKAGTDALAECVMKHDLLRTGGQGSTLKVASPLPNKATTSAQASESSLAPAGKAIETASPAQAASPLPASAASQANETETTPENTTVSTGLPSATASEKAVEINQALFAKVKRIALIRIRDAAQSDFEVLTRQARDRKYDNALFGAALGGGVIGALGAELLNPASNPEEMIEAQRVLKLRSSGLEGPVANLLMTLLQGNGYQVELITERRVPGSSAQSRQVEFYKGQNVKADAILNIRLLSFRYLGKYDNSLRLYSEARVSLFSKNGDEIFLGTYSCPQTSNNKKYTFTSPKKIIDNITLAHEGVETCMTEIATDVAATLKVPLALPAP
jgi:hypothetical protein